MGLELHHRWSASRKAIFCLISYVTLVGIASDKLRPGKDLVLKDQNLLPHSEPSLPVLNNVLPLMAPESCDFNLSAMCLSTQLCVLVLTGSVLLSIFHGLEATVIADEDQVLEAKKNLTWPRAQEQVTSGEKSLLRNFKEWQNSSDLFHNISYQHLAGTLSQKKKLLTTGLSSKQGIYLMSTLMSIHISRIFAPQILTGQLLVTHCLLLVSPGEI